MTDVVALDGVSQAEVLRLAASAEKGSEHPVGQAIVAAARKEGREPRDPESFQALSGRGVLATVDGKEVLLGNRILMNENGVQTSLGRREGQQSGEPGQDSDAGGLGQEGGGADRRL